MRTTTVALLGTALLSSAGCVENHPQCYEATATCTVTCEALPGQVFTGNITERRYWSSGDPSSSVRRGQDDDGG